MASREYAAALEVFPKGIAVPGDSYEDVRRKFAPAHGHDPGPDIAVEEASYGGVSGVWTAQKGEVQGRGAAAQRGEAERSAGPRKDEERVIFFVHGGAFVSC